MLPRQFSHLRLAHISQRKTRAAQLLLRKPGKEVGLVLRRISSAAEQPAVMLRRKLASRIVTSSQKVGANLAGGDQQLVKLQMVVAQAARNRRAPRQILIHERTYDIPLKPVLVIDDVIRNFKVLCYCASVVNVIDGAASPPHLLRHAFAAGKTAL